MYTPYYIAFVEHKSQNKSFLRLFIDFGADATFFFDIVLTFFSAYLDKMDTIVVNKKKIACHYLKGWFLIDFIAFFPFYHFNKDS
jgi:hypothetical protein